MSEWTPSTSLSAILLVVLGLGCEPSTSAPPRAVERPVPVAQPAQGVDVVLVPIEKDFTDPRAWPTDVPRALRRARREGKPVLLDFTAAWCQPCRRLALETFQDQRVVEALARFVTVKVDVTTPSAEVDALKAQFDVTQVPTIVFVDTRGVPVPSARLTRFVGADAMLTVLEGVD